MLAAMAEPMMPRPIMPTTGFRLWAVGFGRGPLGFRLWALGFRVVISVRSVPSRLSHSDRAFEPVTPAAASDCRTCFEVPGWPRVKDSRVLLQAERDK